MTTDTTQQLRWVRTQINAYLVVRNSGIHLSQEEQQSYSALCREEARLLELRRAA